MSNDFIEPGRAEVRSFWKIAERKWSSGRQKAPSRCVTGWGEFPVHGSWQVREMSSGWRSSVNTERNNDFSLGRELNKWRSQESGTVISWEVNERDNWPKQEVEEVIEAKTVYGLHTQQCSWFLLWAPFLHLPHRVVVKIECYPCKEKSMWNA